MATDPSYPCPSPHPRSPRHIPTPVTGALPGTRGSKTEPRALTHARHSPLDTAHSHPRGHARLSPQPPARVGPPWPRLPHLRRSLSRESAAGSGLQPPPPAPLTPPRPPPRAGPFIEQRAEAEAGPGSGHWDRLPRDTAPQLRNLPRVLRDRGSLLPAPHARGRALDHVPHELGHKCEGFFDWEMSGCSPGGMALLSPLSGPEKG